MEIEKTRQFDTLPRLRANCDIAIVLPKIQHQGPNELVGVRCTCQRGLLANHLRIIGVLCVT